MFLSLRSNFLLALLACLLGFALLLGGCAKEMEIMDTKDPAAAEGDESNTDPTGTYDNDALDE